MKEQSNKLEYMMLSRLKQDCDYFLGNGNRNEKHLWSLNKEDHIAEMKRIYNSLEEKPEWLSMEDIEKYAERMHVEK